MAQESLIAFTRYTKPDYRPAGHHTLIADALERVERGECKRLMIFMPPRHGKSELASRRFPAWFLGRNPDRSIIAASYNSELATDFGREVRDIVATKLYGNVFGTRLSDNSQAAGRWHTNGRGGYVAAGVGTAVTGRGAHCFVAGTLVDTDAGPIPIEQLEHVSNTRKVLSYNHSTQQIELQNVQAFAARTGVGIYRVTTAAGRVVEATGDHPFFTERGYIEARSLAAGDRLLCVLPKRSGQDGVCVSQMGNEVRAGSLLLTEVQSDTRIVQGSQALREVRRPNAAQDYEILSGMSSEGCWSNEGVSEDTESLPNVRAGVRCGVAREVEEVSGVLLQDLCGHRALQTYVRTGQPEVEGRCDAVKGEPTWGAGVSDYAGAYSGARQLLLRSMQGNDQAGSSPHRQLANEQQCDELDNALLIASPAGAQFSGWEAEHDYVRSIERIGDQARVFDIQVSANHNFFANGILVHNCLLIDDPFKDRQDADSDIIRERVWRWYTSTAYTRLEGDITATALEDDDIWADFLQEIEKGDAEPFEGAVVLIQCMTGDTPVLMADGSEKALRDVRRGDAVATYENGRISTAKVLNWALQGSDQTYEIRTTSGTTVRANERHPFLVERDGKLEWIRLRDLKIGDAMLRAKGRGSARLAPTKDATAGQKPRATATITTRRSNGPADTAHHRLLTLSGAETSSCGIDTELGPLNTTRCSPNKVAFVPFVSGKRQKDRPNIGAKHSALTIVTTLERSEDCSATTATLSLAEDATSPSLSELSAIYSIDRDYIQSILPSGREDVFDIQVERTENFIANGLVSHNTRWNEDDLGGRLLRAEAEGGDKWEALDLPAIDDAGQALWPEKFSVERLHRIRAAIGPRDWSALYQQRPTPDEGTYFQRAWFHRHAYAEPKKAKATRHVYITSDFAVTDDGGDYTEHAVWGYGNNGTLAQLDWWSGQKDAAVWIERLIDLIEKWGPLCYFGEQGVIEKAVRPMLVRRMRERKVSCRIEWVPSVRDKATRARPFQARASMGKVSLLNDERGERVLGQLLTFPAGRFDDAVDVCSLIGLVIDEAHPAIIQPPKVEKTHDSWASKSDDYETSEADWKTA